MDQSRATWLALAFLLILFAQMALASCQLSLTYDEPIYTAIGYADLSTGDVRWHGVIGHPPLMNLLTAWPLLLEANRPTATAIPSWGTNDSLGFSRHLIAGFDSLERLTLLTRLPVMWVTCVLAAFVYRWAQQAWGGKAGLVALGLFIFDPHILAHGQLNTTDMGVTAFSFIACYALARHLRRPTWANYLGAGLGLGAAMASKTSGLFLPVAFGLTLLCFERLEQPGKFRRALGTCLSKWGGLVGLAAWALWASYLFEMRPLSAGGIPIPAASFWAGLSYQRSNVTVGQTTFLVGRLIPGGHWSYFLWALAIKTPIPAMMMLGIAGIHALRRGFGPRWSTLPLLIAPLVYFGIGLGVSLQIGHRYLLPLLPFSFVFAAQLAGKRTAHIYARRVASLAGFCLLALWYILGSGNVFPDYLTFFNEFAGGPDGGYRYLADSSVDWGQGLKILKRYLDEQDVQDVRLAAFSSLDPALYDLQFRPLPPTVGAPITLTARFNPQPGVYAISPIPLQGVWVLDPDTYDWFRHRQPAERVGHNFFIYRVTTEFDGRWVAQCAAPLPPLDASQIAAGFGRSDLRLAVFDCESSWLYPGAAGGWTVLPGDRPLTSWASERLAQIPLSFRQGLSWDHPALAIYEQRETPIGSIPTRTRVRVAPPEWPPEKVVAEVAEIAAPLRLSGALTFLGYNIQPQSDGVELHTYWRVDESPTRPLSLMAHLLDATGQPVAVGDGLGVPIQSWQAGDIIVQRHPLPLQNAAPGAYWLQTGVYWLDTLERWPIPVDEQGIGDRILLAEISR